MTLDSRATSISGSNMASLCDSGCAKLLIDILSINQNKNKEISQMQQTSMTLTIPMMTNFRAQGVGVIRSHERRLVLGCCLVLGPGPSCCDGCVIILTLFAQGWSSGILLEIATVR